MTNMTIIALMIMIYCCSW